MVVNYLYGVEIIEIEIGLCLVKVVKFVVIGLIGIVLCGLVNQLMLCFFESDVVQFGSGLVNFIILQVLKVIYDYGVGMVVVINVLNLVVYKSIIFSEIVKVDDNGQI